MHPRRTRATFAGRALFRHGFGADPPAPRVTPGWRRSWQFGSSCRGRSEVQGLAVRQLKPRQFGNSTMV